MKIKQFKNWIKTTLTAEVSDVSVYGYIKAEAVTVFPAIMASADAVKEGRLDSQYDYTDITVNVDVIIPFISSEDRFDALYDAVKAVVDALRPHMDGVADEFVKLEIGSSAFANGELDQPIYYCRIPVTARYLETITP